MRDGDTRVNTSTEDEARQPQPDLRAGGYRLGITLVGSLAFCYLVPSPALALMGLAVFAGAAWLRLDLALALLPLTFPFWYVPRHFSPSIAFPLSEVVLLICLAVAVMREAARWRSAGAHAHGVRRLRSLAAHAGGWTLMGALCLVAGLLLGVLVARRPHEALRYFRWEAIEPVLYAALALLFIRRRSAVRVLVWSFLAAGLLIAGLAAIQTLWLHYTVTPLAAGNRLVAIGPARATAFIFGSGNTVGMWMERALPVLLALVFSRRGAGWRERLLAGVGALLCLSALVWSDSRGAWAGALAGCALVVAGTLRRPRLMLALAVLGGALALIFRVPLLHLIFATHGPSDEIRAFVWLAALHMIRDHPLLGIGPDQFLYYYSSRYTAHPYWITRWNGKLTPVWREPDLSHAHNVILNLWLSGGILALCGFAIVVFETAKRLWRIWRQMEMPWASAVALGLAGSLLAALAHGMVDRAYFEPDLALWFWWLVALGVVLTRQHPRISGSGGDVVPAGAARP